MDLSAGACLSLNQHVHICVNITYIVVRYEQLPFNKL